VQPAVVSIVVRDTVRTAFGTRNTFGSGSGVIFREDGYILTNNHVIEDADSIEVTLFDGRDLQAEIVGADPITDLAVIKVDERDMSTVPLGDVSRLRVGDWVVAIGNAAGLVGRPSVTLGVVSAFERTITAAGVMLRDLIQTDALINPGNSGGPLLNLSGEVIGINTAVLREDGIEGIGFAVGAETATLVADQLVSNGRVIWPWLGIGAANVDRLSAAEMNLSVRDGVLVTQLVPGGPADRAGLRVEDVVIAIDDVPTPDVTTLQRLRRREFKVGQSVTVTLVRGSEETEVHLTLAEQPR
jgi:serine protease Do